MNSSVVIILLCYIVGTIAQCPNSNCPPPIDPPNCGVPDCNDMNHLENRYHPNALFPHPDPNFYYQCAPYNVTHWAAFERLCACGSVFNPNVQPWRRCTFWDDRTWQPICNWQTPPALRPCDPWCPDCGDEATPPTGPTVGTPETTTTSVNGDPIDTTTPSSCGCPPACPPCIWWPCMPCTPCWCKQSLVNRRTYRQLTKE